MELPSYNDPVWNGYKDASGRSPCNVIRWIHELYENGPSDELWNTLWEELHHQGDVGEASYAIVPFLVHYYETNGLLDEQLLHFVITIELAAASENNPDVPSELEFPYAKAINRLYFVGATSLKRGASTAVTMGIAAAVAIRAGDPLLAKAYLELGHEQAIEFLRRETGYEHPTDA